MLIGTMNHPARDPLAEIEWMGEMGFEFDFQGAQVVADDPFIDGDQNGGTRWTFVPIASKVAGA